jgi:hypothetical protein
MTAISKFLQRFSRLVAAAIPPEPPPTITI